MRITTQLSIVLLFIASFSANAQFKRVTGNGNEITVNKTVGNFDKLSVSGSFDVDLIKGNAGDITIKAESNLMDYLDIKVENGILEIGFKRGTNIKTRKTIQITVAFEKIESVKLSGSGAVICKDPIEGTDLSLSLSGSGNVKMNVAVENLNSNISGSGNMNIVGTATDYSCAISGSGNTNAEDLATKTVNAKISGSGNVKVNVANEIYAKSSGSGNIMYTGNPTIVKATSSGSGSIQKRN